MVRLAEAVGKLEGTLNPYRSTTEKPQSFVSVAAAILQPIMDQVQHLPCYTPKPNLMLINTPHADLAVSR